METIKLKVGDIKPYERNAKKHDERQIKNVMESIKQFGLVQPVVVDKDHVLIIGHCRLIAAKRLKMREIDAVIADSLTQEQVDKLRLLDNKLNESEWDFDLLLEDIPELDFSDFDIDWGLPETDEGNEAEGGESAMLSDRFIIPPFDIFDARSRRWLDRKKAWNDKIGDIGQARAKAQAYEQKAFNNKESYKRNRKMPSPTSILDPVLAEIICSWFTPYDGAKVFDCFAGDTAFGYVSSYLGNDFTGIELRQEQVDFNNSATKGMQAKYICDDGRNVLSHIKALSQDLLFSCPPYFDLEVYSDKENDASNQSSYEDFYSILDEAFSNAINCLKDNRFAVIVVGDIRNKKTGGYYNFPNDIINTFCNNGMMLYNNIKLLTPIGTAQIRAGRYMAYRKVAHVYQDVLVFYKGNPKNIKDLFGEVKVQDVSEDME